jgi:hypothetical protein
MHILTIAFMIAYTAIEEIPCLLFVAAKKMAYLGNVSKPRALNPMAKIPLQCHFSWS